MQHSILYPLNTFMLWIPKNLIFRLYFKKLDHQNKLTKTFFEGIYIHIYICKSVDMIYFIVNEPLKILHEKILPWEFPGSPVVRTQCFHCMAQVQPLVEEVTSHKLCETQSRKPPKKQKQKKQEKSSISQKWANYGI